MRRLAPIAVVIAFVVSLAAFGVPREAAAQSAGIAPTLIPLSGQLATPTGEPRTGTAVLVISLYEGKDDSAPLWIERQQVTLDATGRFSIEFGATRQDGLPTELFAGQSSTRWIGVAIENEAEQPRVMLVSVPYAARAASADTLAGKSASEFVLSSTFKEDLRTVLQEEGDIEQSTVVAREVLALEPNNLEGRKLQVWILLGQHEFQRAAV